MSKTKPIVVTLDDPIEIGEGDKKRTVTILTFPNKMKAKDLLAMDAVGGGEMRKTLALYASMCGEPFQVMEELSSDDLARIARETVSLMGKQAAIAAAQAEKDQLPESSNGAVQ